MDRELSKAIGEVLGYLHNSLNHGEDVTARYDNDLRAAVFMKSADKLYYHAVPAQELLSCMSLMTLANDISKGWKEL